MELVNRLHNSEEEYEKLKDKYEDVSRSMRVLKARSDEMFAAQVSELRGGS